MEEGYIYIKKRIFNRQQNEIKVGTSFTSWSFRWSERSYPPARDGAGLNPKQPDFISFFLHWPFYPTPLYSGRHSQAAALPLTSVFKLLIEVSQLQALNPGFSCRLIEQPLYFEKPKFHYQRDPAKDRISHSMKITPTPHLLRLLHDKKESRNLHTHHISIFFSNFQAFNKTRGCFLSPACISIIQHREQFSVWKETTLGFEINIKTNPRALVVSPKKQSFELGEERRWAQQMQTFPWILLSEKQNNKQALRYYLLSTWKNRKVALSTFSSQRFLFPFAVTRDHHNRSHRWHCQRLTGDTVRAPDLALQVPQERVQL